MKPLRTAGVKELKNNLSSYLREVRGGATILVTDRNAIIAELHQPYGRPGITGEADPLLMAWVDAGVVTLPAANKEPLPVSPVHLPEGTVKKLLVRDRKESGE